MGTQYNSIVTNLYPMEAGKNISLPSHCIPMNNTLHIGCESYGIIITKTCISTFLCDGFKSFVTVGDNMLHSRGHAKNNYRFERVGGVPLTLVKTLEIPILSTYIKYVTEF